MRLLVNFVGLGLLTAVFCCELSVARAQENTAEALVHDHYPGYHVLRMGERDADVRAFLLEHFKSSNPSVVHADFDGDGQADYAMLVKSDGSASAKLVVLLCDAPKRCRSAHEGDITGSSEEAYLTALPVGSKVAPVGSAEGENQPPSVKLTTVGVQVTYFEKGSVALYWDKKQKKIVEVGTGE